MNQSAPEKPPWLPVNLKLYDTIAKMIPMKQFLKFSRIFFCIILVNTLLPVTAQNKEAGNSKKEYIRISLEKRIPYESGKADYIIVNEIQEWIPGETAIIICDMWDKHWCRGASARAAEMAPFMNNVVSLAREKGVLIVKHRMI